MNRRESVAVAVRVLVLLGMVVCARYSCAQTATFSHVLILFQENRTPDNLFGNCIPAGADVIQQPTTVSLNYGNTIVHTHGAFMRDMEGKWQAGSAVSVAESDVQQYCQLASEYGFADRMFQTNQGPSFPAHQFIFGATSQITATSDLFASENPGVPKVGLIAGCEAPSSAVVEAIDPSGSEKTEVYPCFERETLSDLLGAAGLTWKYYAPSATNMWTAPNAIQHIRLGADWNNVVLKPPQVLKDIANGNLANVSWVIPAGSYSDHPGGESDQGPAWVVSIVNAIGQSPYWQNTAIIVTWDDWGGWYDHVPPPANTTGWCESYCFGFRVPLLVISAYTPSMVDHQQHDFGSIVQFVESNFGLGLIGPGNYADAYADNLSEFFQIGAGASKFVPMTVPKVDFESLGHGDPDDD